MSFRFRLYPTPEQTAGLVRHCSDARYVWNLALEQANYWRPERGATPSHFVRNHQLAEARSGTWLGEGSSVVQQQALRDFDQALQNWWRNPRHFGRPTWRKAGQSEGFRIVEVITVKLSRKWGTVHIPKLGPVRFRLSRPWSEVEKTKSARVTLDRSGRWHVSFASPQPPFERTSTGSAVGLDLGIAVSVATSDGELLRMPALLSVGEAQRKRRLQRRLSRQTKGSIRRARTKLSIARLNTRETDRRKDWIEKTTTQLVRTHDFIAIEDLKVRNMSRSARGTVDAPGKNVAQKRGLNRSISNQAWSQFRKRLEDKATAATSPCVVVPVNPVNTSRRCSVCEHTAPANRQSQAVFSCQACGHTSNADVNAALNILTAARKAVAGHGAERKSGAPSGIAVAGNEVSSARKLVAA